MRYPNGDPVEDDPFYSVPTKDTNLHLQHKDLLILTMLLIGRCPNTDMIRQSECHG